VNDLIVNFLEKSLEIFRARGGARLTYHDSETNQVCAVGAMHDVSSKLINQGQESTLTIMTDALSVINRIALENYENAANSILPIAAVNDLLGKDAVIHCYQLAIKKAKGE
jgi:hypothetical protein